MWGRSWPCSFRAVSELQFIRRCIFGLLLTGFMGTLAELLLAEHTEDPFQWIPIILLALGIVLLPLAAWRGGVSLRLFQYLMVTFIAAGILGGWQHYGAKQEFALEREPALTGLALFVKSLEGSSPPLLAPGAMVALALLGLTWTYRQGVSR